MELLHLRYVVAAAEHRSFRRAAAALNITQPTLSKRIRELEERLGMLLFKRSAGGTQLTANGEDFLVVSKRVLAELDGMENYAKATKAGKAGRLQIGFYTAPAGPLSDIIFGFNQQHPQLDLNVIEDDRIALISLLDRGTIDIAMVGRIYGLTISTVD
jgi:DNA-binding transcriptional LysR family regulator